MIFYDNYVENKNIDKFKKLLYNKGIQNEFYYRWWRNCK